jgi:AraC-like DNA-binding protein
LEESVVAIPSTYAPPLAAGGHLLTREGSFIDNSSASTMQDDAIPIEYVRLIAEQLQSTGVAIEPWLDRGGVRAIELAEPDRWLAYAPFRRLVLGALEDAREPALGLFVGQRLVASTHGAVGAAAVNARTVRQALEVVERFSRLRSSIIAISHEVSIEDGRVLFTEALPLGDIQRPLLEAVVLSIKNVLDEITMGACRVFEVAFPFDEPEYAPLARELFRCPVRYGESWAGFRAAPDVLDLPLKLANDAAFEAAARICQRELDRLAQNPSLAARVRRLLLERQPGFASLQVAARLFHMTPRTLHRRLVDEGTSYRELIESVRHTLAVEHVKSGQFKMDEIAYRLGYTDLANFRRAFKRWEKEPPSAFRARQASKRPRS